MSLINKMLQDLDTRGSHADAAEPNVKPVQRQRAPMTVPLALGAGLLLVLAAAGWFGWRYVTRVPTVAVAAAPSVLMTQESAPASVPAPVPVPVPALLPAPAPVPQTPAALATAADVPVAAPGAAVRKEQGAAKAPRAAQRAVPADAATPAPASVFDTGRQTSAPQRAESEYRRALAHLQEGRIGDAIAALEQALKLDPGHEAARQTLVGLLIENKRPDEAMRQLQLALAADPRQPAMAMLLARLQIERGAAGIDTLQRSLAYAAGNADYHAFLAGALQRLQRHGEAAEQYMAALRANPQNGVWLMGLGISLQADKRNADARDAFQRAKASASLVPELQAFVERKLLQLGQ